MRCSLWSGSLTVLVLALFSAGCDRSPDATIASAEAAWNERHYRSAIIQLKALLQENPESLQVRWMLGQVYLDTEDGPSAEKELRRAAALGVSPDSVLPGLAQALLIQKDYKAVLELEDDPQLSPVSKAELDATRAVAHLGVGQVTEAEQAINAALQSAPLSPVVLLAQARYLVVREQTKEALGVTNELLELDPTNGQAWSLKGILLRKAGDKPGAEGAFTKAIELRVVNQRDRLRRGLLRASMNDLDGAMADAEALKKIDPRSHLTHYLLGLVLLAQEDLAGAEETLEQAYAQDPTHMQTLYLLSVTHARRGNRERAGLMAERAFGAGPNFAMPRKLLAAFRLEEGQPAGAEELLRPVVATFGEDREAKGLLARSLIEQGKTAEAAVLMSQIAAASESDPAAYLRSGEALLLAGREEDALAAFSVASDLAPDEPLLQAALVVNLLEGSFSSEAIETATAYVERNPGDADAVALLGIAHAAAGDDSVAARYLKNALALEPGNSLVHQYLADKEVRLGNLLAAKAQIDQAVKSAPRNIPLLIRAAEIHHWAKDSAEARRLLEQAIETSPTTTIARVALARLLIREGQADEAINQIDLIGADPAPEAVFVKAEALQQLGETQRAIQLLEPLRNRLPDSPQIHYALAVLYSEEGASTQVKTSLENVIRLAPESLDAKLALVRLLAYEGRQEEGLELLNSLDLPSDDPRILKARLSIAQETRDSEAQVDAAQALFQRQPSTASMLALAAAYGRAGEYREASSLVTQWIEDHPQDAAAFHVLTGLKVRLGDQAGAMSLQQQILGFDPDNVAALNNLAWDLRKTDPQRALQYSAEAYRLAPDTLNVIDTHAEVLARNGLSDRALVVFERVVSERGNHPVTKLRLAEVLYLGGKRERALLEVRTLAQQDEDVPEAVRDRARELVESWR